MSEEHQSFIKTPKQLIAVVVTAFIVPVTCIILFAHWVVGNNKSQQMDRPEEVVERIRPVGQLALADANSLALGKQTGEQVYQAVCMACHQAGLLNAPKFGDKTAWGKLIASSQKTLVQHALQGIRAMPARGGNPDLSDFEVERAVVYMANQAGAGWKEPQ